MVQQLPKVSVIVPVYNTEKYLTQCLESVCSQTLKEIEIICIDDGSTDSSPEILESFRLNDPRIQVYHQENRFCGTARNVGMKYAAGEYLAFWDSDDYYYENALQTMYEKAKEDLADICVCEADEYYENLALKVPSSAYLRKNLLPDTIPFNKETNPDHILNFTSFVSWNKLFRRAFMEEHQLMFQDTRIAEDVFFSICAICLADQITVVPKRLMCYRRNRADSLWETLWKSPLTPFEARIEAREALLKQKALPEKSFANNAVRNLINVLYSISHSASAFQDVVTFLKQKGLSELGLLGRGSDYFYNARDAAVILHLENDSIQDFTAFFMHDSITRFSEANLKKIALLAKHRKHIRKQKKKIESLSALVEAVIDKNNTLSKQLQNEKEHCRLLEDQLQKQQKELEILKEKLHAEIEFSSILSPH